MASEGGNRSTMRPSRDETGKDVSTARDGDEEEAVAEAVAEAVEEVEDEEEEEEEEEAAVEEAVEEVGVVVEEDVEAVEEVRVVEEEDAGYGTLILNVNCVVWAAGAE